MRTLLIIALLLITSPVMAQDSADKKPADSTLEKRIELAKKMHEINPVRDQVDRALEQVAETRPPSERDEFVKKMVEALNYKAIEKASIDAMVETYTAEELQAMVNYYGSPEGQSIKKKYPDWAAKVMPEITRMLDVTYMRLRTGQ